MEITECLKDDGETVLHGSKRLKTHPNPDEVSLHINWYASVGFVAYILKEQIQY